MNYWIGHNKEDSEEIRQWANKEIDFMTHKILLPRMEEAGVSVKD